VVFVAVGALIRLPSHSEETVSRDLVQGCLS
jgi:hypothetical protein